MSVICLAILCQNSIHIAFLLSFSLVSLWIQIHSSMGYRGFCLYLVLLALSLEPQNLKSEELTCNPTDLRALASFSNCLESAIAGWNSTVSPDCCTWSGIICDNSTVSGRRVVGLELGSKRLTGKICESLAGLNQLRVLNLSHNFLWDSLPAELFSLQNIEIIDLSNNDFLGSINNKGMRTISTRIEVINFSNNHFSGQVPKDLANCTFLNHLSSGGNSLLGSSPEIFFQLKNHSELNLQGNWISGPLSNGIGNLSNLVKLDISSNLFSGVLPNIFGSLARLEHFSATSNSFTGHLPNLLVNSPSLKMSDDFS